MRLVEQKDCGLDDPIRKHIPTFKVKDADASARATVRDTLTHMSGWEGDFFDDPSSGDDALARIVERMATLEQTAKVGEMWGYNNSGFYAAGRIIEVVTGKPFERAMRDLVLDPIGIDTAYYFPAEVMTRRFVVGHGVQKGATSVLTPWPIPRAANAAGGITTNVGSMLRYAAFHMGNGTNRGGTRVLSAQSLEPDARDDRAEGRQRRDHGPHMAPRASGDAGGGRAWRRHHRTNLHAAPRAGAPFRPGDCHQRRTGRHAQHAS